MAIRGESRHALDLMGCKMRSKFLDFLCTKSISKHLMIPDTDCSDPALRRTRGIMVATLTRRPRATPTETTQVLSTSRRLRALIHDMIETTAGSYGQSQCNDM